MERWMETAKSEWRRIVLGILTGCAALGWWGAIYPQFTMVKGTYEIVCEDDAEAPCEEMAEPNDGEIYWKILETDSSHIRFKSRLLVRWNTLQEQRRKSYESGDQ